MRRERIGRRVRRLSPSSSPRSPSSRQAAARTTRRRNAYADAAQPRAGRLRRQLPRPVGEITSTTTPGEGRKTLQGFEDAVDDVVTDLRAIEAPGTGGPLHHRLIDQIAGYGEEIRTAKEAYETRSPRKILDAQSDLVDATTEISGRINRTIAAINKGLQADAVSPFWLWTQALIVVFVLAGIVIAIVKLA